MNPNDITPAKDRRVKYQEKKRAAGLCTKCGHRPLHNKHLCIDCSQGKTTRKLMRINVSKEYAKKLRQEIGLTQGEVAAEMGHANFESIKRRESGHISLTREYIHALLRLKDKIDKNNP